MPAEAALAKLTPSRELAAALGPGSWAKVDSARGNAKDLPTLVIGVFADDPAIASYALDQIWLEIEHQETVYGATYRVATALAAMLPRLADRPVIERRVVEFLCQVMDLGRIGTNRTALATLVRTLRGAETLLETWAEGDANDPQTLRAIRLLARIGGGLARAERQLRGAATPEERAYAVCAYACAAPKRRKPTLQSAFADEADPFVRFVIAQYLVREDKVTAPDVLAAIEPYLADPSEIQAQFATLVAFLGDDIGELIRSTLPDAALAIFTETMIDELGAQNLLAQVSYLDTIFRIVFAKGLPRRPSQLQQRALHAVAAVIDESPNFGNHMEVFARHRIPYDAPALRAAAKPTKKPVAKKPTKPTAKPKKPAAKKPAPKKPAKKPAKKRTRKQ